MTFIRHFYKYALILIVIFLLTIFSVNAENFVVVIDAGHGGKDVGAVDNNVREKDINLSVALELGSLIKKKMKNVEVVYTRDKDQYLTLQQRADKANKSKGNLFISIHTNSVSKKNKNRKTVSGASTYTLGLHKEDDNMDVARRENSVIELESDFEQNYRGFDPNSDESYIIFEIAQSENMSQSIRFANEIQKEMATTAGRKDRGVHQAGFWVLWATSMPSVLVELDFICNPISAKYLASSTGQKNMAKAIFNAFSTYYKWYISDKNSANVGGDKTKITEIEPAKGVTKKTKKNSSKTEKIKSTSVNDSSRRRRSSISKEISANQQYAEANIPETENKEESIAQNNESQPKKQDNSKTKVKEQKSSKNKKLKKDDNVARLNKKKTIYKIQVLASKEQLKESDSRFCGFSPISCIEENGLYKYTYGETEKRKEAEELLKKVKQKIPDAFIIQLRKGVKTIIK